MKIPKMFLNTDSQRKIYVQLPKSKYILIMTRFIDTLLSLLLSHNSIILNISIPTIIFCNRNFCYFIKYIIAI